MENVPLHSRSLLEALNTLELDVLKNVANLNKPNPDFTLTDIENIRAHLAESLEDSELSDDQIKDISGKYKDRWEEAVKKFRSANLNIQKWWETQLLTRKRTELLNNASIQ
ncbi:hypothetical protein ROZALSC1DRAFT_31343 [Rozella allomycis CSF55]|uniref:Uncharacterized protein n=1 Tax=Rozella allomycis (strain CSF55) TaxID=988480 RepID=A0A075B4U0_ROZAC|nr:hypothetical protein O9G_005794 [Rozella allomycis CSF55]RKP16797.1 hypothetical protein ROZALSC1DRAFT_31343 [Rozella allomycis CSF55]|eukprot:EPZ36485.1 hypothetical protein O9G_005794 [Rozella allomycis CSF55]